jgi:hypothetical protein
MNEELLVFHKSACWVIQFLIKLLIEGGMMKSTDHNLSKSVLPILDRIQVLSCDSYLILDFAPIMASFRTRINSLHVHSLSTVSSILLAYELIGLVKDVIQHNLLI